MLSPRVEPSEAAPDRSVKSLFQLALRFLRIGSIGFGGGLSIIALMERECVRRFRCLETEEFLHGVGLGQFLGAFSVNTAFFIGYRMFGLLGGLTAAVCFLLPSVVLVIALSWLYFTFHTIPSLQGPLLGLGPVLIALILSAAWSMGRKALRSPAQGLIALFGCLAGLWHWNPFWILVPAGLLGLGLKLNDAPLPSDKVKLNAAGWFLLPVSLWPKIHGNVSGWLWMASTIPASVPAAVAVGSIALPVLIWVFLKVGFILVGGGYVLIPLLHQHLVVERGWLTPREFLDGVAVSQLTPGPIAILATFAGYRLSGIWGAVFSTMAVFLPSIILMWLISYFYKKVKTIRFARDIMAGVAASVVGLIVSAALVLAPGAIHFRHPGGWFTGLIAFVLLTWRDWHPAFVLAIGASVGALFPHWFVAHFPP